MRVHDRAGLLGGDELIGARKARPVEQGIGRDGGAVRLGLSDPELNETGEFLLGRRHSVDGDASGRAALLVFLARAVEVAGALEGQPVGRLLRAIHHAEAGKAEVRRQLRSQSGVAIVETGRGITDLLRHAAGHQIDADRERIELVDVKHPDRKRTRPLRPYGLIGAKFYFLRDVEVDFAHDVGDGGLKGSIWLGRKRLCSLSKQIKIKPLRRSEPIIRRARRPTGYGGHASRHGKREGDAAQHNSSAVETRHISSLPIFNARQETKGPSARFFAAYARSAGCERRRWARVP